MKKEHILGILFFGGLWGLSEAVLGDALYSGNIPFASVPLTVIGFVLMAAARVYFPQIGTATFVAGCAMLYKFLNAPFFACHLLGILLTGVCYDLFVCVFRIKNRSLSTGAAVYLSYTLFALMITYVFRYEHWVQAGVAGVLRHIILVPASLRLGGPNKAKFARPFNLRLQFVPSGVLAVTVGLWIFSIAVYVF